MAQRGADGRAEVTRPGWGLWLGCAGAAACVLALVAAEVVLFVRFPKVCGALSVGALTMGIGGWWLYGKVLLVRARRELTRAGKRGVLVYSNSPRWQVYVEREWLPRFGRRFAIINWSERARWRHELPVLLWRRFVSSRREFNPAVLVLRGLRRPRVYRFYPAFVAAKHGDDSRLHQLEAELLQELESER